MGYNLCSIVSLIARFMGPTWGTTGADRTQVGPMLASWTLLSGIGIWHAGQQMTVWWSIGLGNIQMAVQTDQWIISWFKNISISQYHSKNDNKWWKEFILCTHKDTSPSTMSYGVSVVSILDKIKLMGFNCIHVQLNPKSHSSMILKYIHY